MLPRQIPPYLAVGFERDGEALPLHGSVLLSDKFNPQIVLEELGQQRQLPWRSRGSPELWAAGGEPMACSFTRSTLWPVPTNPRLSSEHGTTQGPE